MKKPKIDRQFYRDQTSVRTASKFYSFNMPGTKHIFTFKFKNQALEFTRELELNIDLALDLLNEIISDLYHLYRIHWRILELPEVPELFRWIDFHMEKLVFDDRSIFDMLSNLLKCTSNVEIIMEKLQKVADKTKSTIYNHALKSSRARLEHIYNLTIHYGQNGKWGEYSQEMTWEKLF